MNLDESKMTGDRNRNSRNYGSEDILISQRSAWMAGISTLIPGGLSHFSHMSDGEPR